MVPETERWQRVLQQWSQLFEMYVIDQQSKGGEAE